jgi:RNA polymerase sigma-70 factor (ECF subfamily)
MTNQDCVMLTTAAERNGDVDETQRFRVTALPYLDDVYTLARYLVGNPADAEDAAQECYLRAFRHFRTFRGGPIKPWLLAILRNVCRAEYARRGAQAAVTTDDLEAAENCVDGLWANDRETPESHVARRLEGETVRALLAQLPDQFREVLVLREINDLSYREIADVIGAPVGTVMSRLARGRALLRDAWIVEEERTTS